MICSVCKARLRVIDTRSQTLDLDSAGVQPVVVRLRICAGCGRRFRTVEVAALDLIGPRTLQVRERPAARQSANGHSDSPASPEAREASRGAPGHPAHQEGC
jgi:hypothetical protein